MNNIELEIRDNLLRALNILDPEVALNIITPEDLKGKSRQMIFYGAPGTGKSHEITKQTKGKAVVRTTFHPDSDYSTFVGAYKPIMDDVDVQVVPVVVNNGISLEQNKGTYREKRISYKFVMQAFMKAYMTAWKKMTQPSEEKDPQFLIIEEINRGNCAQIFGDLFQLLDRGERGFSEYPIEADADLQQIICEAFKTSKEYKLLQDINVEGAIKNYTSNYGSTLSADIQNGRVLLLPPNLYIWATMNTSDQSLFPIDSAFKRRWDWKYIPIANGNKGWKIKVAGKKYDWWEFLNKINDIVEEATSSEDKKLGYFFVKADENNEISSEKFVSKVVFYLWNDVFKDYGFDWKNKDGQPVFKNEEGKDMTFKSFFNPDGSILENVVASLLDNLQVPADTDNNIGSDQTPQPESQGNM